MPWQELSATANKDNWRFAMTLATKPQVLLLDEPLAGMGVAEAERMIELLLALKNDHAML